MLVVLGRGRDVAEERVDGCGVGRRGSVGLGVTVDGSISGAEGEAGWSGNIGKI